MTIKFGEIMTEVSNRIRPREPGTKIGPKSRLGVYRITKFCALELDNYFMSLRKRGRVVLMSLNSRFSMASTSGLGRVKKALAATQIDGSYPTEKKTKVLLQEIAVKEYLTNEVLDRYYAGVEVDISSRKIPLQEAVARDLKGRLLRSASPLLSSGPNLLNIEETLGITRRDPEYLGVKLVALSDIDSREFE